MRIHSPRRERTTWFSPLRNVPGLVWFHSQLFPAMSCGRPTRYENGVLPRLAEPKVTVFIPWGPRYAWRERGVSIQGNDKEVVTLRRLAHIQRQLSSHMPATKWDWFFLAADLYGFRLNHLEPAIVKDYFGSLSEWLPKLIPDAKLRYWSEFDEQAKPVRDQLAKEPISLSLLSRAEQTAERGGFGNAKNYLIERMTEARLIEELYRPIKMSLAPKHKDVGVDGNLPCIYMVPKTLQAPWL